MSGLINSAGSRSGVIGQTELDYEEGAWTPVEGASWTAFGTFTGSYTKIGRMVYLTLNQTGGSSNASGTGASITGLPFVCDNDTARPQGLWGDENQTEANEARMIIATSTLYTQDATNAEINVEASITYLTAE